LLAKLILRRQEAIMVGFVTDTIEGHRQISLTAWAALTLAVCTGVASARSDAQAAQVRTAPQTIAITHVTVVDVVAGKDVRDQTVLVEGQRIVRVGSSAGIQVPSRARQVDGRGKFLIPGLWDMHVHLFGNVTRPGTDTHELSFPLLIANGVTGVRDMWTDLEDLHVLQGWRRDAVAGLLLMPLVVPTSTVIDGPPPSWPTSPVFTSPDSARHFVDSLVAGGVRTIKVLGPTRDVYYAVIDEAKKLRVSVVGHVPPSLLASDVSTAGQRSIEHLLSIPDECSKGAATIDSLRRTGKRDQNLFQRIILDTYDDSTCDALIRILVSNDTWVVPTQALRARMLLRFEPVRMRDPRFRYAAAIDTTEWAAVVRQGAKGTDSATAGLRRRMSAHLSTLIGRMYRGGVSIMTGTDLGNPFIVAGYSLHDELASFVQAGLTPAEALRTATIDPARFLGAADSVGSVAAGKRADLVLLDVDPLLDIGNTTRIRAVLIGGHLLTRKALDALLATAARLASGVGTARGGTAAPH
jgi:imidazolonepropionase-like amidohydrolase